MRRGPGRLSSVRVRFLAAVLAGIGLTGLIASPAEAASGPRPLQRLATLQTQLLFRDYNGLPQIASPSTCRSGPRGDMLVLPSLSFGSGDATFTCDTTARAALLDLGGAIATEDKRGDTYALANGVTLLFTRMNLPRICDDVLRFYDVAAPATVDNRAITGTEVATDNFTVKVNPGANNNLANPYFQDSVDLGHPGRLAACFGGWKAVVPLSPGRHVIHVDLTAVVGATTQFTYDIRVGRAY